MTKPEPHELKQTRHEWYQAFWNSQSEHCMQCSKCSDWTILKYESKIRTRKIYVRPDQM